MKTVLNFFIFLRKDFTITKMLKTLTREQKLKNAPKKHLRRKIVPYSLVCIFVLLLECLCDV